MYKKSFILSMLVTLSGCAGQLAKVDNSQKENNQTAKFVVPPAACLGNTDLPADMVGKFEAVDDPQLLANATAGPGEGKLCQGKVYQLKQGESVTVYRAWNSRNVYTRLGSWWAAAMPQGKTAAYQTNYEICYTWSPLDKMVQCDLKPGTKVVIGTGQSVSCPPPPPAKYPETYILPVSKHKQVYFENAQDWTLQCKDFDNNFNWTSSN